MQRHKDETDENWTEPRLLTKGSLQNVISVSTSASRDVNESKLADITAEGAGFRASVSVLSTLEPTGQFSVNIANL